MTGFPHDPALEAAIVANADEDTPRLVYADWLDEHGDHPRAEFIRVQCALTNGSPADREWVEWVERENELAGPMRRFGLTKLPGPFHFSRVWLPDQSEYTHQDFHRGFLFFCDVPRSHWGDHDLAEFADALTELLAATAVRGLNFRVFPNVLPRMLELPALGAVRGLVLGERWSTPDIDREGLWSAFAESPVGANLIQLRTGARFSPAIMDALAAKGALRNLRRLTLPLLACSPDEAREWFARDWARRLQHVFVVAGTYRYVAGALAGLGELPELHSLVLHNAAADEVRALAAARFPKLAALTVTGLTVAGFRTLLATRWFEQIRALRLGGLGDQAVTALAKHPAAQKLRGLWFGRNQIGKNGLRAFTRRGAFPELSTLDLSECGAGVEESELLNFASRLALPHLKRLNLAGWPLGDAGARALASNAALAGLTQLNLERCNITAQGQKALHESPHLRARFKFGTN